MDWTLLIAVWGAVTGTLAVAVTVLTYRRDRARLVVTCSMGVVFNRVSSSGPLVIVEAVNVGRRPIRLESAGFIADRARKEKLATFGDLHTFPKTLGEGEKVSVQVKPASLFEHSIGPGKGRPTIAYFLDSAGGIHKAKVPETVLAKVSAMADSNAG